MSDLAETTDDREALDLLIRGFQVSRMLRLVADLAIADKISEEGCDVRALATACAVKVSPLLRVLRALAAFDVFRVRADGDIDHSPRSLLLRTDLQNSMHHGARFWTGRGSWRAWGELDVALQGGVPHEAAWKVGRFQYLRENPDEARQFDLFMANFPDNRHAAVAAAYDFSGAALVTDVGGGNGATLRHILAVAPKARGVLFDRLMSSKRFRRHLDWAAGSKYKAVVFSIPFQPEPTPTFWFGCCTTGRMKTAFASCVTAGLR